jgi:hypothetical protein
VEGNWRIGSETLALGQTFQKVSGTLGSRPIADGQLRGDAISFTVNNAKYTGRVAGTRMSGTYVADGKTQNWSATKN